MNSMSWFKLDVKLAFFFKRESESTSEGGRVPVYMQTFEPPTILSLYPPLYFCSNQKPHLAKQQKLKEQFG